MEDLKKAEQWLHNAAIAYSLNRWRPEDRTRYLGALTRCAVEYAKAWEKCESERSISSAQQQSLEPSGSDTQSLTAKKGGWTDEDFNLIDGLPPSRL